MQSNCSSDLYSWELKSMLIMREWCVLCFCDSYMLNNVACRLLASTSRKAETTLLRTVTSSISSLTLEPAFKPRRSNTWRQPWCCRISLLWFSFLETTSSVLYGFVWLYCEWGGLAGLPPFDLCSQNGVLMLRFLVLWNWDSCPVVFVETLGFFVIPVSDSLSPNAMFYDKKYLVCCH